MRPLRHIAGYFVALFRGEYVDEYVDGHVWWLRCPGCKRPYQPGNHKSVFTCDGCRP